MIIKSMDASFGKLENAHMELEPGLNIIEAPNEAGKSTWCAFIRIMLYGINTAQRERGRVLPDKKRFLPWGSYPMAGRMDINWRGGEARLNRRGAAGKPMGNCEAKHGTSDEKIAELCGKAPGEIILGVPESVFCRSAFISAAAMTVDKDAELEKRISALITSGSDEDEAYSTARQRLHSWQIKRRHNARVGREAELGGLIKEKEAALEGIQAKNARMADIFAQREEQISLAAGLEQELCLHEAAERRHSREKAVAARAAREAAENRLGEMKTAAAGVTAEKIEAAREAVGAYKEAAAEKRAGSEALARYNVALEERRRAEELCAAAASAASGVSAEGVAAARRALYDYEAALTAVERNRHEGEKFRQAEEPGGQKSFAVGGIAAAAVLALGVFACVLGLWLGTAAIIGGAVIGVAGVLLLIIYLLKRSTAEKKNRSARETRRAEFAVYENAEKAAAERFEAAKSSLLNALAAIGGETIPERAAARIEERAALLKQFERDDAARKAAAQVAESLAPAKKAAELAEDKLARAASLLEESLAALNIDSVSHDIISQIGEKAELLEKLHQSEADYAAALKFEQNIGEIPELPENEPEEEPTVNREEATAALALARRRLGELERQLALAEGELNHLGDPLVLATELESLRAEFAAVQEEYEAIALAISVLDDANAELQQRFSPIVGELAGRLLAAMTGDRYRSISFDRDFNFAASQADGAEHAAEYLSAGTLSQMYLAVRLAVCLLALPAGESCPIILDDALLGFDDERARAALKLLRELAQERQIILFTCQGREKRLLESL